MASNIIWLPDSPPLEAKILKPNINHVMFINTAKNITSILFFIFSLNPPYFSFGIIKTNNIKGKYTILQHDTMQDNIPIKIFCFLLSILTFLLNARFNMYAMKKKHIVIVKPSGESVLNPSIAIGIIEIVNNIFLPNGIIFIALYNNTIEMIMLLSLPKYINITGFLVINFAKNIPTVVPIY